MNDSISFSYPFGFVPPLVVLAGLFRENVGETYSYCLVGERAETADEVGLEAEDALDVEGFYDAIGALALAADEGHAAAGDLASELLATVGIEWTR